MIDLPPIRREIIVDAAPQVAFDVFTQQLASWWPLADFSVRRAGNSVAFTDSAIIETSPTEPSVRWGTVTLWDPPDALAFTWHPGTEPERSSQVRVTFTAVGDRTRVELEHSGWGGYADPNTARTEYGHGWPVVLERFRSRMAELAETSTWVALLHRPTAAAPPVPALFADERFGQHLEFLEKLRTDGYLVAAGPLPDEPGAGMAILRLPGADRVDEARTLATDTDPSIANGLFSVEVRPWQVMLHR